MIQLWDVCKSFDGGKTFAVNHLSLTVHEGEPLGFSWEHPVAEKPRR